MKREHNIQHKVESNFKAIDSIETINAPHFFKDKTLQRLFSENEKEHSIWSWFTPQLQLASLVCVVLINVYAIQQMKSNQYNEAVSSFASDYGLTTESESSLFSL